MRSRPTTARARRATTYWTANVAEAGHYIFGYESVWLPAALLAADRQDALADALFASSRIWPMELHFQKALAGAPPEAIAATRDTAINPAVLDAFVLVIIGSEGAPAYPGLPGYSPDLANARHDAAEVAKAMAELRKVVPEPGSYLAETRYFERDWQKSFWGSNYPRLRQIKNKYDPQGLFFVHHGVAPQQSLPLPGRGSPGRVESYAQCLAILSARASSKKGHAAGRELPKACRAVERISSDSVGSPTARASVIAPTTPARVVIARRRRAAAVPLHRPASSSNAVRR